MPIEFTTTLATAPTTYPITWADAKAHMRLDADTDQQYVESLIATATDYAEESLGMSLMQQTRTAVFHESGGYLYMPMGPVVSVTSVVDANDVELQYTVERFANVERLKVSASYETPVTVTYVAGHASSPNSVDASIRHAIKCHVASLYEVRQSIADRSKVVVPQQLADFYRLKSRRLGIG